MKDICMEVDNLIKVLKKLRDLGNTVIVVEHEEEIMRAADQIIDIGPDAGAHGGHLIFQGTLEELEKESDKKIYIPGGAYVIGSFDNGHKKTS